MDLSPVYELQERLHTAIIEVLIFLMKISG